MTWTLSIDESGRFEGDLTGESRPEGVGLVLGGLLVPVEPGELEDRLRTDLKVACDRGGVTWPPHANELTEPARGEVYAAIGRAIARLPERGRWLFLVDRAQREDPVPVRLLRYVHMLGELIDLAARVVAGLSGQTLHVVAAQRTVPIVEHLAEHAQRLAIGTPQEPIEIGTARFRAWTEAEARHASEALGREARGALPAYPRQGKVDVHIATFGGSPAAIFYADLGCNHLYRSLGASRDVTLEHLEETLGRGRVLCVSRPGARIACSIDQALREEPPSLLRAATRVHALRQRAGSDDTLGFRAGREGAVAVSRLLWEAAAAHLAVSPPAVRTRLIARLANDADLDLAAKHGAYEGCWDALETAWAGEGALARASIEAGAGDRVVAARLWRLTLECANHRGDVARAGQAAERFADVLSGGTSLRLLAEELVVLNLLNVMAQNRLPAPDDVVPAITADLRRRAEELTTRLEQLDAFLDIAPGAPPVVATGPDDPVEVALWVAAGREGGPRWRVADRERGELLRHGRPLVCVPRGA